MDQCARHFETKGLRFTYAGITSRLVQQDQFYSQMYLDPLICKIVKLNKYGYEPPAEVKIQFVNSNALPSVQFDNYSCAGLAANLVRVLKTQDLKREIIPLGGIRKYTEYEVLQVLGSELRVLSDK